MSHGHGLPDLSGVIEATPREVPFAIEVPALARSSTL